MTNADRARAHLRVRRITVATGTASAAAVVAFGALAGVSNPGKAITVDNGTAAQDTTLQQPGDAGTAGSDDRLFPDDGGQSNGTSPSSGGGFFQAPQQNGGGFFQAPQTLPGGGFGGGHSSSGGS